MAFVGNRTGPRQSQIIRRLGREYFGCSAEALEEDISDHIRSEDSGEVVPVHVDDSGQPYLVFLSPTPGVLQHFYLEASGYQLFGDIQTYEEKEQGFWEDRVRKQSAD
jgi:hypothetical protein